MESSRHLTETSNLVGGSVSDCKHFLQQTKMRTPTSDAETEHNDLISLDKGTPTKDISEISGDTLSIDPSTTSSDHDDTQEEVSDAQPDMNLEEFGNLGGVDSRSDNVKRVKQDQTDDVCTHTFIEKSANPCEASGLEVTCSPTSWAAMRLSNSNSASLQQESQVIRRVKSILNKLTVEKFPTLSKQLASCGITSNSHLRLLVHEVFAKATTQHHFIDMYADLLVILQKHFAKHPIEDDEGSDLMKILSNRCQACFESDLIAPPSMMTPGSEQQEAIEQITLAKRKMIGNIKLIGALIVRDMLACGLLFTIANRLLDTGTSDALETLAAFLLATCPVFDQSNSQHRIKFKSIFHQLDAIASDTKVQPRVQFLLRDVLELRAIGWQDTRPKKLEAPSTLEDVAQKFYGERLHLKSISRKCQTIKAQSQTKDRQGSPASTTKLAHVVNHYQEFVLPMANSLRAEEMPIVRQPMSCRDEAKEDSHKMNKSKDSQQYDRIESDKQIANIFMTLVKTHDIHQAVSRIVAVKVPEVLQAGQLYDLLSFIVEADADLVRSLGFELIVAIYLGGCWSKTSFGKGFENFMQKAVTDKICSIKRSIREMMLAFDPLFQRGFLPASVLLQEMARKERAIAPNADHDFWTTDFFCRTLFPVDCFYNEVGSLVDTSRDATGIRKRAVNKRSIRGRKSLIDKAAAEQQKVQKMQEISLERLLY